jgi:DNA invertase Pin-like site-specific DNA recombinase
LDSVYLHHVQPLWNSGIEDRHLGISNIHMEAYMKAKRAAVYLRVSTCEQSTEAQKKQLLSYIEARQWTLYRIYSDEGHSGASETRPQLTLLMNDARHRKFDVVIVWKFDRFARSLRQLISALEVFRAFRIAFVSATEAVDTSLPSGELLFQIVGAIAQFERSLIAERVRAGIASARSKGVRVGRPPLKELTTEQREEMKTQVKAGMSIRSAAKKYRVSRRMITTSLGDGWHK